MSQFCFRCGHPVGLWTVDEAFDWCDDPDDEEAGFDSAIDMIEARNWPLDVDYENGLAEFRLPVYGVWADGNKRLILQVCADCHIYYGHLTGFETSVVQLSRVADG